MWDPYEEFETTVLPNGLTVYCAYWPNRPWVAMSFLIHAGARQDKIGLEGTAHFVEHAISRNQTLSYQEIKDHFESLGGDVQLGVTGFNRTYYQFFAPTEPQSFEKSLSIFGDMLLTSKLDNYIDQQREVIIGEYQKMYSNPLVLQNSERRNKNVFRDSWKERFISPLGSIDSIKKIDGSDLQLCFDSYYTPNNISIVCTGGMKNEELLDFLSRTSFSICKTGQRIENPTIAEDIIPPHENLYIFEVSKHIQMVKKFETASFETSCRLPGSFSAALVDVVESMLNEILFSEIREKRGWTYFVDADTHFFLDFYRFQVNVPSLALAGVDKINDVVSELISSLPYRKDLFEKIVKRKIATFFMKDPKAKQVNEVVMRDLEYYNRITTYTEDIEALKMLTTTDVAILVEWLRHTRRWTFITVP